MRFEHMALADAQGAFLVHGIALPDRRMKKGRILSADDLIALAAAGHESVLAARMEADDVAEDAAANRIAQACQGMGVRLQPAFTGRANLFAETPGLIHFDRSRLDQLNRIDEAITIASLAPYELATAGQMLATIKIIPFAAAEKSVAAAERLAAGAGLSASPLISLAPFTPRRAALIMTRLAGTKDSVLDKTAAVLRQRLEGLGSQLAEIIRCAHDQDDIAAALKSADAGEPDLIMIFGASAITDRRDEIPAGIEQAGGDIEHFGMPVDPGNLLLLGKLGGRNVIGLPGCARSPKLNGFDWVLQRFCAGLEVGRDDITAMGAGGLLKEISTRPQPRRGKGAAPTGTTAAAGPRSARIAGLVLAAGQSRRMGVRNKMLAKVAGKPMLAHVLAAAATSNLVSTTVITGNQPDAIAPLIKQAGVVALHNPDFAKGLSTSLRAGMAGLPDDIDGVLIMLGDMPKVSSAMINRLIAAFDPLEGRAICVPTFEGKRGNPVLFAIDMREELLGARGDSGAKAVIGANEDLLCEVAMDAETDGAGVLLDVDTPSALSDINR